MTSRERVLTTLAHREPDRVAFDLGSTPVTGIHHAAYRALRAALWLPAAEPAIWHMMQQLAFVDEDVHEKLDTDVRGVRPKAPSAWKLKMTISGDYLHYTDEFGIVRRSHRERGQYFDLCGSPFADGASVKDIESYPWPDAGEPARIDTMRAQAEKARASGKAVVMGGIGSGMLEFGQSLRGYESFYCDLASDRKLVEAIAEKVLEQKVEYWTKALAEVGDLVDVVQEGDDYGGQNGLLISTKLWRDLYKARLTTLFSAIKGAAPHVKVFFHTCGSVRCILPDLIEAGVDILNPVQVNAKEMDSKELKRDFGDAVTFWGGGVDTQFVLPNGTPQQVRDEVKRRIDDLAPGGGFVFAVVHNIQADVPVQNVLAVRKAVADFGCYGRGTDA